MGCYGICLARTLAAIVEAHHDEKGIIWPEKIAPFFVYLISLQNNVKAEKIYRELRDSNVEVLYDDRNSPAGVKFADADLLGIPVLLVVSEKTGDQIEWKKRHDTQTELLDFAEVINRLKG